MLRTTRSFENAQIASIQAICRIQGFNPLREQQVKIGRLDEVEALAMSELRDARQMAASAASILQRPVGENTTARSLPASDLISVATMTCALQRSRRTRE
jgi:hypothetical protein